MDCRTCEPTLIDLVHDELATDAAADARVHLAECASCRASFERLVAAQKLAAGLEVARPPQQVTARLLQLAEAQASELRAQATRKAPAPTFGRAVLDFVARFAMGRQVGMATIMLLIVAVGLWSLPRMRHEPVAGGTVVDADGEAGPSPGVEPADRLDLKVDPRSRRIRSNDGQAELAQAPVATALPTPTMAHEPAAEPPPPTTAPTGGDDPLAELDDLDDLLGAKKEDAPVDAPQAELSRARAEQRDRALGGLSAQGERLAAAADAMASRGSRHAAADEGPQAFPASPQQVAELEAEQDAPAAQTAARAKAKQAQAPTASAPAAASEGSGAADELKLNRDAASGASSTASLLESARSVARTRGCSASLASYERVVAAGPGTREAGTALVEMALCKRSLGLGAEAQRLLERAARIPATAERARSLQQSAPAKAASP